MSEIEKICVHFKDMNGKVGNSGQTLYYCDARDFVLGEDAKVCFVCDEYKPGKNEYDEQTKQSIVDFLSGKRKREGKRWTKKKGTGKKSSTRKSRDDYDEDEEEEEPEGEEKEEEEEAEEGEEEEAEEAEESEEEEEEGEEAEEVEEGEEEEEGEEDEDGERKKKKPAKKASASKKPAAKEKAAPKAKPSRPAKEVVLDKEDTELLELVKSKGDAGIIQMNIKDESKLPSSKISKIVLKLKDAGLIVKEKAKVKDDKGKTTITNLLRIAKH